MRIKKKEINFQSYVHSPIILIRRLASLSVLTTTLLLALILGRCFSSAIHIQPFIEMLPITLLANDREGQAR